MRIWLTLALSVLCSTLTSSATEPNLKEPIRFGDFLPVAQSTGRLMPLGEGLRNRSTKETFFLACATESCEAIGFLLRDAQGVDHEFGKRELFACNPEEAIEACASRFLVTWAEFLKPMTASRDPLVKMYIESRGAFYVMAGMGALGFLIPKSPKTTNLKIAFKIVPGVFFGYFALGSIQYYANSAMNKDSLLREHLALKKARDAIKSGQTLQDTTAENWSMKSDRLSASDFEHALLVLGFFMHAKLHQTPPWVAVNPPTTELTEEALREFNVYEAHDLVRHWTYSPEYPNHLNSYYREQIETVRITASGNKKWPRAYWHKLFGVTFEAKKALEAFRLKVLGSRLAKPEEEIKVFKSYLGIENQP